MIVAVPSSTAVIVAPAPDPDTVATDGALLLHATAGEAMTMFRVSFTTAVTDRMSPADAS